MRPILRWEGDIKMDLDEVGWSGLDWIQLFQDRDKWRFLESDNEPSGSTKYGLFLDYLRNG